MTCHNLSFLDIYKSSNVTDAGVRLLLGLDREKPSLSSLVNEIIDQRIFIKISLHGAHMKKLCSHFSLRDETFQDPHNMKTKLHHHLDDGLITQRNENYKTSTSPSNMIYIHLCEYKRFTFEHSCCPDHERKMFLFHYVLYSLLNNGSR